MKWTDFEREDLRAIPVFEEMGWGPIFDHSDVRGYRTSPENAPHYGVRFGLAGQPEKPQVRLHSWINNDGVMHRQWELWALNGDRRVKGYECQHLGEMLAWLQMCGYGVYDRPLPDLVRKEIYE